MDISTDMLFTFLTNYLLAFAVSGIGCFVREAHNAIRSHTKINSIKIITETIFTGFVVTCLYKLLETYWKAPFFELHIFMCFMCGFWSDSIIEICGNKGFISSFLQNVLSRLGRFGKIVAEAWKESDKADADRKEKMKNLKDNNIDDKNKKTME